MQSPPMTLIFHYQMEATQQEGLTGNTLEPGNKIIQLREISYGCFHSEKYRIQMLCNREGI